jgi:hypothetical protein
MKRITFLRVGEDAGIDKIPLSIVHPAPHARLVKTALINGADCVFDPAQTEDNVRRLNRGTEDLKFEYAETEDEFVMRIAQKDVPVTLIHPPPNVPAMMSRIEAEMRGYEYQDTPFQLVEESAIPADRTFRNAWILDGDGISHDMPTAREIQKNCLRALRTPKLAALDAAFFKAFESGDVVLRADIEAEKQALRDVTKCELISEAVTPEELKAAIPDMLK